ncbi:gliding motility lipoprotein GldH [Ferruginibacter sp. SUN002]|uniref:gliding motility lipoprotein GldH n=1 Tax=Ferruginibacter sp. SUN002 TaxID=2937789 RepID=UPI003D36ED87
MKRTHLLITYCFLLIACITSCNQIDVFERNASIPKNQWSYNFQPDFEFNITDTAAKYNLYAVIRHTDAYKYNNIWLNIGTQAPADTMWFQKYDFQLGTDATGWEGTGMDDIWEVRTLIIPRPFQFKKPGKYKYTIGQVMRENPLPNILSVGIRVEKIQ